MVNANSRSGASAVDRAISGFTQAGIEVHSEQPASTEHCAQLINHYRKRVGAIVLGGGDGTMHGAAAPLLTAGLPLGILPLGTANDLARTLKIPRDLDEAIRIIILGATTRIYLGRVNGRLFFNIANIGLGVRVNQKLSGNRKQSFGAFSYADAAMDVVRHAKAFNYTLKLDDDEFSGQSIQLAVGNGRYYGGGMKVDHASDLRKPCFYVYSMAPRGLRKMVTVVPRLMLGRHKNSNSIVSFEGKRISLTTDPIKRIYADGESIAFTPAHFEIAERQLTVFSPLDEINPLPD
jgi:YegS/Rv2252/BmrU family lipid kinase